MQIHFTHPVIAHMRSSEHSEDKEEKKKSGEEEEEEEADKPKTWLAQLAPL